MKREQGAMAGNEAGTGWPHTPGLPVVIGVAGHRNPQPESLPRLREAVQTVLDGVRGGLERHRPCPPLALACGLAEGADQLVAELRGNLPLIAIAPMPLADYWTTFKSTEGWQRFETLWRGADMRIELPWIGAARDAAARDAQFQQLARVLARHCHVLLALWDGDTTPPLLAGGTAQAVTMRREGELAAMAGPAMDSTLFPGDPPLLELSSSGPVVQVVTPRTTPSQVQSMAPLPGEPGSMAAAGDIWWWSDAAAKGSDAPPGQPVPVPDAAALAGLLPDGLTAFGMATRHLRDARARHPALCASHESYLRPEGAAVPEALLPLVRLQAAVDVAAGGFQRKLLGDWSLGLPWSGGTKLARARGGRRPRVGALLLFAVAVPLAVVCYEWFAHLQGGWWALAGYAAMVFGTAAFYLGVVHRNGWQERFQDYRALAEALRVQVHWAACGVPAAVSDNYLRQHADELGWVRQALRGPALLGIAAALAADPAGRRRELDHWAKDQAAFFIGPGGTSGKAAMNEKAQGLLQTFGLWVLGLLAVLVAATGVVEVFHLLPHDGLAHKVLVVALGVVPALAAVPIVVGEGRGYEAHVHAYRRAGRLHRRAAQVLADAERAGITDRLALELGREALVENAAWLVSHRERRVSNRMG